jgi:hypothetical protein
MSVDSKRIGWSEPVGNIILKDIRDTGELEKERIVLQVSHDDDIGGYVIFEATTSDNHAIYDEVRHVFWFPEKDVKAGDLVVLYTKSGIEKAKKNKNGSTSHFFYWSLERALWKRSNAAVVIANLSDWTFISPRSRPVDSES